ncbi:VWA domain-containing protein [Egibacter rhizosphaerae]|uniref:VWA domain-containing protein n=1 Tax=Egibacter rhizosphaerae TaxID=1670831 RepID=A0A411YKM8_9ACTN|nr:VWA domain-containing protein [Egibacter rhizosphaerae]QBI21774.1 VWA domain-containing protein [Egibacter rhizosphaerae]
MTSGARAGLDVAADGGAPSAIPTVVGFAHALRSAGVAATPDRVHAFVSALDVVDATSREEVFWAGRTTLCASAEDLPRYDRVFAAYFHGVDPASLARQRPRITIVTALTEDGTAGDDEGDEDDPTAFEAQASRAEVLRDKDVADLGPREQEELHRLLEALSLPGEQRRTRRWEHAPRGRIDRRRTIRRMLQHGGEPAELAHLRHRRRPRRVVLIIDVSGSMAPYADALLRFAHAASRAFQRSDHPRPEVFTLGTRLTRVTRELSHRDADAAMRAVAEAVPDWSGGTRLGELLKAFLDRWGQRGMARGAVVVVLSDGWERGDPRMLGEQVGRLRRLAHRVVWANPRKARPGYAPLAGGIAAALPNVDDFVSGHSLAALEHLARVVAGVARGDASEPIREEPDRRSAA